MSGKNWSTRKELIVAVLGLGLALMSAWSMVERVRLVDIITLFFGGLAAGVSLGMAIAKHKAAKAAAQG